MPRSVQRSVATVPIASVQGMRSPGAEPIFLVKQHPLECPYKTSDVAFRRQQLNGVAVTSPCCYVYSHPDDTEEQIGNATQPGVAQIDGLHA